MGKLHSWLLNHRSKGAIASVAVTIGAVALGVAVVAALREGGDATPATAGGSGCEDKVRSFDRYPLLYLGEEFEGLPLVSCEYHVSPGTSYGTPPTERYVFIYGRCTIPPDRTDGGCAVPLQVTVYPPCGPSITPKADVSKQQLRGVDVRILRNDAVYVETSAYKAKISVGQVAGQRLALTTRAFDALRGANDLAAGVSEQSRLTDASAVQPGLACE